MTTGTGTTGIGTTGMGTTGAGRAGAVRWAVVAFALFGCAGADSTIGAPSTSTIDDDGTVTSTVTSVTSSTSTAPGAGAGVTWVVEVVDGDTLRVEGPGGEERVRLVGVNAPEAGECFHDEATAALRDLVAGVEIRLVADETDRDRFGRLLRFVETVDGVDVNGELVQRGVVRSQRYEPDVSRNDRYDQLQAAARDAGRGLWAPDACGPATATADVSVDARFDAPGDDNENLNGEWVWFTNDGGRPLDLTGWRVADESSTHRYVFDRLVLPSAGSVTLFTGCGTDSSTERYWCRRDSAVWNNAGDTVFLQDPNGNVVVAASFRG